MNEENKEKKRNKAFLINKLIINKKNIRKLGSANYNICFLKTFNENMVIQQTLYDF